MKRFILFIFLTMVTAGLMVTCVSKKKYRAAVQRGDDLQKQNLDVNTKLAECNTTVAGLKSQTGDLQTTNGALAQQNRDAINELNKLSASSKMTIAQQANRLRDLQNLIQAQKDTINKVKNAISAALVGFAPDELTVYIKDGKIYVALEEKLLFKSGSDVVDAKGKQALGKLAEVLNKTSNINVEVTGYTDNVPIHTAKFADNWALSVGRATAITRILTASYNVDPNRVTASGMGQYHPVQSNDTPDGRQANRRTEIVLSPNLKGLYNLVNE